MPVRGLAAYRGPSVRAFADHAGALVLPVALIGLGDTWWAIITSCPCCLIASKDSTVHDD